MVGERGRKQQEHPWDLGGIQRELVPAVLSTHLHHAYCVLSLFSALDVDELVSLSQQAHEVAAVLIILPILQVRELRHEEMKLTWPKPCR